MLRLDHTHFDRELRPPLGSMLVRKGLITKEQLEDALARVLAEQHELEFLNLRSVGVDRRLLSLIPADAGLRLRAVPVRHVDGDVLTAVADPNDRDGMAELAQLVAQRARSLRLVVAEPSAIAEIWQPFTR